MIYYKIRSKKDPTLFRKADGTWNKTGKVYDTLGKLRALITNTINYGPDNQLDNWEIVEYEVTENAVKSPHEMIDPKKIVELLQKKRYD